MGKRRDWNRCPFAGYLLFESIGARQRLAQWKWIRMRITTPQYIEELKRLEDDARQVVDIFGQIRSAAGDCFEYRVSAEVWNYILLDIFLQHHSRGGKNTYSYIIHLIAYYCCGFKVFPQVVCACRTLKT